MDNRRTRIRILGVALALYGVVGVVIFVGVAVGVARPLDRAQNVSESVEAQRTALADSLTQAEATIRGMSTSVNNMDTSLSDAKTAVDRAATISHGLATSMFGLRDAMSLSIFGTQPLIGLAGNFDTSGQNLDQLGTDVAAIGTALDANRTDVTTTAQNMTDLAESVHALTVSVRDGPGLGISSRTLGTVRLAVYVITGWLALFALGCLVVGIYLIIGSRKPPESD